MMLDRVRTFVRQHDLIRPGARVIAALSGGSDSVALACVLHEFQAAGDLWLVGLAHLNHQLRSTADRDEEVSRALAASLDVPILADRVDVARRAQVEGRSIEDAGHAARYEFFDRAREHFNADVIALGHTRDDQAETFLLRLIRGAGPRGLAAMYPRNGAIVRPLLDCRRGELRAYLAERQARGDAWIQFVDDESNNDVSIPRNRIRAELLPLLETRFNPSIVDVLAGEADVAREVWQALDTAIDHAAARIVRADSGVRTIDVQDLQALDAAVRRGVVWRTMRELSCGRPVSFAHVADALRVASADGPGAVDAPGQRVERIGNQLVLRTRAGRNAETLANLFRYPLSIPGEVQLREARCIVSAEPFAGMAQPTAIDPRAIVGSGSVAAVRADLCGQTLGVRNRRPGDRFEPVGLGGRKKLQDFFVDRKVARAERDRVPIVVDELDRIVWVAGHRIDEAFRVTNDAQHVLLLRLRPE